MKKQLDGRYSVRKKISRFITEVHTVYITNGVESKEYYSHSLCNNNDMEKLAKFHGVEMHHELLEVLPMPAGKKIVAKANYHGLSPYNELVSILPVPKKKRNK